MSTYQRNEHRKRQSHAQSCLRHMRSNNAAVLGLILMGGATALAQPPGTITADPNAVELKKIWEVTGDIAGGDNIGFGVGGLGDIFGTGYGVWAICDGTLNEWRFYMADSITGALPTPEEPFQRISGLGAGKNLIVGDFWGTGHKAMVLHTGSRIEGKNYFGLHVFRTDSNRLDSVESAIMDTYAMNPPAESAGSEHALVADLNGDGADEMIVPFAGLRRNGVATAGGEVWIFKGGANFQLDTPTVVLQGADLPSGQKIYVVEDFNGNGHPDMMMLDATGASGVRYLRMFWGDGTLEGYNNNTHHRIVRVGDGDLSMAALDCDGDHIADLVLNRQRPATERGAYLFRSGTGKSAHTRSYQIDDADLYFRGYATAWRGGHVNDTAGRYELMWMNLGLPVLFNGGPNGPDVKYDAYLSGTIYGGGWEIPDIDGDGWNDYIEGNPFADSNGGAAAIFAGGPYIPRDRSLGVEDVAVAGVANAISLWPNPAREELHIAWRGDLRRMPRRFQVHDLMGQQVASGEVEPGTVAAVWRCQDAPAGIYLVSIFDADGVLLATAPITRQEL